MTIRKGPDMEWTDDLRWCYGVEPEVKAKFYSMIIPLVQAAGRELGYCIAVHGSQVRDLDLIAVPWTEEAVPVEELVRAVYIAACGSGNAKMEPVVKPHGRLAYVLFVGTTAYIDLSVLPMKESE